MTDRRFADPIDYFDVYRAEPEAVFDIPATADGQPLLTISIAALGGATVGNAYADNDWIYAVHADDDLVASGIDLHCASMARTHRQMAVVAAFCLAAAIVGFVADDEASPLAVNEQAERLSLWADDIENADAHE